MGDIMKWLNKARHWWLKLFSKKPTPTIQDYDRSGVLTPQQISALSREELETRFIVVYDALDHINRVSRKSRTSTHRHDWIQARANCALNFKEWTYPDLGLKQTKPKEA